MSINVRNSYAQYDNEHKTTACSVTDYGAVGA